ncbi:MAG: ARPP-1 family domain-containing protein [bacterium]
MKNLFNRFKRLGVGLVQHVNGMSVVPLIEKEKEYENIAPLEDTVFEGTADYGSMKYRNDSEDIAIVPSNSSIISKQSAQDHAMSTAGLIAANNKVTFHNACCIESSQGGFLRESNSDHLFGVLPVFLRKALDNDTRFQEYKYGKIWNDIGAFNDKVIDNFREHLSYFFEEFEEELNDFLAEFETVPNQIGALVYFGSELVGIEIAPNRTYWNSVWNWLIRGCYGAEYLRNVKISKASQALKLPNLSNCSTLNDISIKLEDYFDTVRQDFLAPFQSQLQGSVKQYQQVDNFNLGYTNFRLDDYSFFAGDVVTKQDEVIYLSVVR